MMTITERFRANAARMECMARGAATDAEREVFLGFAQSWRRLAEDAEARGEDHEPPPPTTPEPVRFLAHAEQLEHQARAARSQEERDLFRDMAARWRQLAEETGQGSASGGEARPLH